MGHRHVQPGADIRGELDRAALGWLLGRKYDCLEWDFWPFASELVAIFANNCINNLFGVNAATLPNLIYYRATKDQASSENR